MLNSNNNRVQSRLLRVFVLQLVLISTATIIGVYAASLIVERLLVNRALLGEAEFFWNRHADNPDFPLPETLNLSAFLSTNTGKPVPHSYQMLGLGQHRVDDDGELQIVHVSEVSGEYLYLVFAGGTVSRLAFYFGILPLIVVLLTMYGFAFLTYRLSKEAVSPITRLASVIENFDFNKREANELNLASLDQSSNSETEILASALNHFVQRSSESIERERNFTRFASHELRTPLAVIQGSVSSLELLDLTGAPDRAVQRIKRTSRQMGELLNTLLLLAREENEADTDNCELQNVNEIVKRLCGQHDKLYSEKGNKIHIFHRDQLRVQAPESVLSIVLSNVLGNAFSYTREGSIHVTIEKNEIIIADTGIGMDKESVENAFEPFYRAGTEADAQQHQGLGLSIVRQSCRNFGWDISLDSAKDKGTKVTIHFR